MSKELFISGIPDSHLSVSSLTNLFAPYGTVIEAKIHTAKRLGWITMSTVDEGMNVLISYRYFTVLN